MTDASAKRTLAVALALTVLGAALRFATLAHQSYWLDEAYTVRLLHDGFGHMLGELRHQESTPPLYYVLAWPWARVVGFGPAGLRALSALAGTLTVPVVFAIGARVARPRAGAVAAAIVAVDPLAVWFSQEARAYGLATLFAALSLLCLVLALDARRPRWWAAWAVASALALATHYFTVFVIGPELVWVLARERGVRRWAPALGVVAAGGALLPLALAQRATGHAAFISAEPLGRRMAQVPKQLLVGYATPAQAATAGLAALLAVAAVAGLWSDRDRTRRARGLLVLGLGVIALMLPVALAVVGLDYLDTRNLLPVLPVVAVALGAGFTAIRAPILRLVAPGALAAVLLAVTVLGATEARYQRDDWRGLARALGPASGPRAVVVSPASGWIPLAVFDPGIRPMTAGGRAVREIDLVATAGRGADGAGAEPPRPTGAIPLPAGFALAGATTTQTYTVVRFRAARAVAVTPATLGATHLSAPTALALTYG